MAKNGAHDDGRRACRKMVLRAATSQPPIVTPGLTRGPAKPQQTPMNPKEKGGWTYIMANRYRGTI